MTEHTELHRAQGGPLPLAVRLGRIWGFTGVGLLLARPAWSLAKKGWEGAVVPGLGTSEWLALVAIVAAFTWGEGIQALGRRWVPRVVERIRRLGGETSATVLLLAPLYAIGLVCLPRRTLLRSWVGVAAIVLAVVTVRAMPHPWRGMIELGVSAALTLGVIAVLLHLTGSPEAPVEPAEAAT